jgi:nitrate/nitrite-specific signal transduction histidine kinase
MNSVNTSILVLRRNLRASMGDRDKLSKLHSVVTEAVNNSYGEEKELLLAFRKEVKDALNCRVPDSWGTR